MAGTLLQKVKTALRQSTTAYDENEIIPLIDAAKLDLGLVKIVHTDVADPLIERAIILYCKLHFGSPDDFDRLERSYNGLKAQLMVNSDYTVWR